MIKKEKYAKLKVSNYLKIIAYDRIDGFKQSRIEKILKNRK